MVDIIDPTRVYQINGQVYPLLWKTNANVVGNNAQWIAAVSGKRIAVMGWIMQGAGGAAAVQWKSATAGTVLLNQITVPDGAAGLIEKQPLVDRIYFETNTGEGLFADTTLNTVTWFINYIAYKP